ncbi:hypothetical protein BBJ28_00024415 [Nothophytophthora sp. Chile5]|nr:hypothetical protein BBJ28_00024415 [Nothophytophthora sp. Chile5]
MLLLLLVLALAPSLALECRQKTSVVAVLWDRCVCEPCARCQFHWLALECRPLRGTHEAAAGSRNGSGTAGGLQQPLLLAEDWFLTETELLETRMGSLRPDLQLFTRDNVVTLFPATNLFFESLYHDVEALPVESEVLLTAWSLADVPFLPRLPRRWRASTFRELFGRALGRNVSVHALVWANALEYVQNVEMQLWMNHFPAAGGRQPQPRMLFDDRLSSLTASHHQKTVVLRPQSSEQATVAYVGGVDLTTDRWDTIAHNESVLRRLRGLVQGTYDGWIDAALRLEGPAADDVAANFLARWNSPELPLLTGFRDDDGDVVQIFSNPPVDRSTNVTWNRPSSSPQPPRPHTGSPDSPEGLASVQIARTFSCKVGYSFAPDGEASVLRSRLKAIANARNFVYVEDQYFVLVPELQHALLDALRRGLPALVVVTQRPTLGAAALGYAKLLYEMLAPLQHAFPTRVHAFTAKPELQLYTHSKVVLVDDVFLSLGSANWNQRSMTSDSELAANVVGQETVHVAADGVRVSALARAFRLQKLREFTGRDVADLDTLSLTEAVAALDRAAHTRESLIATLDVARELYFDVFPDQLLRAVDPSDRCDVSASPSAL